MDEVPPSDYDCPISSPSLNVARLMPTSWQKDMLTPHTSPILGCKRALRVSDEDGEAKPPKPNAPKKSGGKRGMPHLMVPRSILNELEQPIQRKEVPVVPQTPTPVREPSPSALALAESQEDIGRMRLFNRSSTIGPFATEAEAISKARAKWNLSFMVYAHQNPNALRVWYGYEWTGVHKHPQSFNPEAVNETDKEQLAPTCSRCIDNNTFTRMRMQGKKYWLPFCRRCHHWMILKATNDNGIYQQVEYDNDYDTIYICNNCQ